MAARLKSVCQDSTSSVGSSTILSLERFSFESQISTDLFVLDLSSCDDSLPIDSRDDPHEARETDQSTAAHPVLADGFPQDKYLHALQSWPTSPQPVVISTCLMTWYITVDIALLAISFAFLIFAILVVSYDQKPTGSHQRAALKFEQASKWGPTIYPILFASVVGRATHAILLWRIEKGERISTLDILAGSTSLTSTVVSQFHLRTVNYVGLGLVAIWMLSPVGGQASFRQITLSPKNLPGNASYSYVVPGPAIWAPDGGATEAILNNIYVAAILSPATTQGSPRDTWGHIKVPRVEHYEDTSIADHEGWYTTSNGTGESYSSFIGIPISGMDSADYANYAAKLEASYLHLNCSDGTFPDDAQFKFNHSSWLGNLQWTENTTERSKSRAEDLKPFAFAWSTDYGQSLNCTIETAYVEVAISCATYTTCSASRVRRSRLEHPPVAYTLLGLDYRVNETVWEKVIESSFELLSAGYARDPTDPRNLPQQPVNDNATQAEKGDITPEKGATRLGQMLNAYWAAMNGKNVFSGAFDTATWLDNEISWEYQDGSQMVDTTSGIWVATYDSDLYGVARTWPSTGTKRSNVEVFQAHYQWVVALVVSSTILIVASLVPLYVRTKLSCGPDILMNFSSLATRDNPYVALPVTGTHLDAADRSRFMRHVRIRFGDVEGGNSIGRLGIGRLDGDVAPLRKGRQYA